MFSPKLSQRVEEVRRLGMVRMGFSRLCFAIVFSAALSASAFAVDSDRTHLGHNISIEAGEEVSEATCFGCSIRVRGKVDGDVTTFGGSVVVEDGGQVAGDVTSFAGDVSLESGTSVGGDLTVFGGRVRRDSRASVGGEVDDFGWRGTTFLVFGAPFVFLGALIGLAYWIVQRVRRPVVRAPVGRG
jgi:hypothetical protein